MLYCIVNTQTNTIEVTTTDAAAQTGENEILLPAPEGVDFEKAQFLRYNGTEIVLDTEEILKRARYQKCVEIKAQAKALIEATDWQLQRAEERESCGFTALSDLDDILTARENIRQSSNKAEAAVNALTTEEQIASFTWDVENLVEHPNRITKKQFLDLFTDQEIATILAAAQTNATLEVFYEKVKIATYINLNEQAVQLGLQMLELGGFLAQGRAAEILKGTQSA